MGGGAGRILKNEIPGAGKFVLQLVDILANEGLAPGRVAMSAEELATMTGQRYRKVADALAKGYSLGLLSREQDSATKGRPAYKYGFRRDWEPRAAWAAVNMRTFGRALDKGINGALGLQMHAERLLDPERENGPALDDAQRETLKAWKAQANLDFWGLSEIADRAAKLGKDALQKIIKDGAAVGADRNRRALEAARRFDAEILVGEKVVIRQRLRLFRHWAWLNGYYELSRQDEPTTRLVESALKSISFRLERRMERLHFVGSMSDPNFGMIGQTAAA